MWRLKEEAVRNEYRRRVKEGGVEDESWSSLNERMRTIAKEVCGETRGAARHRGTWWWSNEVQEAITTKRRYYKRWQKERTEESREAYNEAKKTAKQQVARAKEMVLRETEDRLNTVEGRKEIFRISKQRLKDGKDIVQQRCLRKKDGSVVVGVRDRLKEWRI